MNHITLNDFNSNQLALMSILTSCFYNNPEVFDNRKFADIETDAEGKASYGHLLINAVYTMDELFDKCHTFVALAFTKKNRNIEITNDAILDEFDSITTELWNDIVHGRKIYYTFKYITPFGRGIKVYEYHKPDCNSTLSKMIAVEIKMGADYDKLLETTMLMIVNEFTNGDFMNYFDGDMEKLSEKLRCKMYMEAQVLITEISEKIRGGLL